MGIKTTAPGLFEPVLRTFDASGGSELLLIFIFFSGERREMTSDSQVFRVAALCGVAGT